ncbi:MAG: M48 family metalloprotease [Devosiaceae bacterium]|nr:M48 family metalloprotease [Devosiaceae bacterium MH13]
MACLVAGCLSISGDEPLVPLAEPTPEPTPTATMAAEEAIGAREHPRILAAFGGVYEDPELETRLVAMLRRVIAASDEPSRVYRLTLLNSATVNAFALPGGYLYVTRGLLALANDEAEVAAVVAHEIGHVTSRHAIAREEEVRTAALIDRVLTDVLSDPSAAQLVQLANGVSLAQFSQNQELEADQLGVRTIGRAGYDPFAAARFLDTMAVYNALDALPGDRGGPSFLSSHPTTPERVEAATRLARQFGAPGIGETFRDRYLDAIDGLVFGEPADEGVVRGRRFLHSTLRIAFEAPEGFMLDNTPQAVLGAHPDGRALRFDAVELRSGQSLEAYLNSGWIDGLDRATIETSTTNGLQVATADADAGGWQFKVAAIRVRDQVYRFIFASRSGGAAFDALATSTVASFRPMSEAEANAIEPLRIDVVTVQSGDSVARLARRMATGGDAEALFRVLNNIEGSARLRAGDRVKIVVD